MNLIRIYRDKPEYPNGACEMDIQEQDLSKLQARGWKVKAAKDNNPNFKKTVTEDVTVSVKEEKDFKFSKDSK